jgi:adenylate cyclase
VQPSRTGRGEAQLPQAARMYANLPAMTEAARDTGFFNTLPDLGDGIRRRVPLAIRFGSDIAVPLALATLRAWRPQASLAIRFADFGVESLRFGEQPIPVAEDGQMLVNYRGPTRTFPRFSASDVLHERVPPEKLRAKLVLIGVTASGLGDVVVTPFGALPGVELHATVLDNIVAGDFISQPRWLILVELGAILAFTLALGAGMQRARGWAAALLGVAMLALYLAGSQWLFLRVGFPLGIVYPLLGVSFAYAGASLHQYLTEERDKRKLRTALEMYVSSPLARLVSEQPSLLKLGGDRRDCTVLFLDIRDFTKVAEGLEPTRLVDLVNAFFGEMTEVIFAADGMLDKYLGDGIMAVWGALLPQPDHAARACRAALQMVEHLGEIMPAWSERGWPQLAIGIGLSSGPMAVGNMGSARRFNYTAIGDNVNLGARLQDLNKFYGSRILASEATVEAAGAAIVARELDLVRVKGRTHPVRIFEILGAASEVARWQVAIERFAAGLAAYRERRWEDALSEFEALRQLHSADAPARRYVRRCQEMLRQPPTTEWDAITTFASKEGE